jgi:hypothetical protein
VLIRLIEIATKNMTTGPQLNSDSAALYCARRLCFKELAVKLSMITKESILERFLNERMLLRASKSYLRMLLCRLSIVMGRVIL